MKEQEEREMKTDYRKYQQGKIYQRELKRQIQRDKMKRARGFNMSEREKKLNP